MHFTKLKDLTDSYKNTQDYFSVSNQYSILNSLPDLSEKGKVSVIASRPGMGKTTLMLQKALDYAINQNKPGFIFSLEMNKEGLFKRMLKVIPDFDTLIRLPINICDDVLYFEDIRKIMKDEIKDGIVFIDYLGLIQSKIEKRTAKEIVTELKEIAEQQQISIVLSSQLSPAKYEDLIKNRHTDLQYYDLADKFIFLSRKPSLCAFRHKGIYFSKREYTVFFFCTA